jgi:hypothetical protein
MAFAITQLADEPVVIVTIDLPLDRHMESLRSAKAHLTRLVTESRGPFYVIIDVREQDLAFSDILIGLDELGGDRACWANLPDVHLVAVGTHPLLPIGAKRFRQQLDLQMDTFETFDDALAHIRDALAASADPASRPDSESDTDSDDDATSEADTDSSTLTQ